MDNRKLGLGGQVRMIAYKPLYFHEFIILQRMNLYKYVRYLNLNLMVISGDALD